MAADREPTEPLGRRERKRLETRATLERVALELFAKRGYDDVTVADIADAADVDPTTFYRHFGSKDAVLFAGYTDYLGHLVGSLRSRPAGEVLFESIRHSMRALVEELLVNPDNERLREGLMDASPAVRAQGLVMRELLVTELAQAIAERMGVDPSRDPTPQLLSALWINAAEWYRMRAVASGKYPAKAQRAVDEIVKLVQAFAQDLEKAFAELP